MITVVGNAIRRDAPAPAFSAQNSSPALAPLLLKKDREMEAGPQPLDALMKRYGWCNHDLVLNSDEHLTHKMVQKARKGRMLTRNLQEKLLRAVNRAGGGQNHRMEEIFNYRGR